jgi:hypothetical protein
VKARRLKIEAAQADGAEQPHLMHRAGGDPYATAGRDEPASGRGADQNGAGGAGEKLMAAVLVRQHNMAVGEIIAERDERPRHVVVKFDPAIADHDSGSRFGPVT